MATVVGQKKLPIQKHILYPGKGEIPNFSNGAKVTFHYITRLTNDDHTEIDNSRKDCKDKPMELIFGKKFKLEVWEHCLEMMKVEEVASFTVNPSLLLTYPIVMKTLRDVRRGKPVVQKKHCCGGMGMKEAQHTGYDDLDDLQKNPQSLEFILELLTYSDDGTYEKDIWAMNDSEKETEIPKLKEEADTFYREKRIEEAAESYGKALGMLEQLMLREKPRDEPWFELDNKKIPLLLNVSQCKLLLEDFYPVVEHTTEVLEKDPSNVKALFRRGKAHIGLWNPEEARADFDMALKLDRKLQKVIREQLSILKDLQAERDREDRQKLAGKLIT